MPKDIFKKLGIDIKAKNSMQVGFLKSFNRIYQNTIKKFECEEVQEYFHNMVAALMIEFEKIYEDSDIKTLYRIKSPKSLIDKILEYMVRTDKAVIRYDNEYGFESRLKEEIHDMLAITVVLGYRPPTFSSKDSEIKRLVEEKNENNKFTGEMQKFMLKLVQEEFSGTEDIKYNYNCTKKEYYNYCITVAERTKKLFNPNATRLLEQYDALISLIKEKQSKIEENECIDEKTVKEINFVNLFKAYRSEIYDNIDLNILTKQLKAVINQSKLLKRFGVTLDEDSYKETRTNRGYCANFLYLNTPVGKIELQLQTRNQNRQGSYGYAAHFEMDDKAIEPFPQPDENDEEQIQKFKKSVEMISPKKFVAQFDDAEPGRIITHIYGEYQNYKSLMSQVKSGSKTDLAMKEYFGKLYSKKDKIFSKEDSIESFIEYDIEEYLNSKSFKKVMKLYSNKENQAR